MLRNLRTPLAALVAASGLALFALPAVAQTTIDFSTGAATAGFSTNLGNGSGQTFTVPANVTHLVSVSLGVSQNAGTPNYDLRLHRIAGGTIGALIDTSAQTISAGATYPTYELDTLTLAGSGLAVTSGETFVITGLSASVSAFVAGRTGVNVYAGGSAYFNTGLEPADEVFFRAVFTDAAPPTPVPTMTEWSMILLGLMLAGGSVLYIQRRHTVA